MRSEDAVAQPTGASAEPRRRAGSAARRAPPVPTSRASPSRPSAPSPTSRRSRSCAGGVAVLQRSVLRAVLRRSRRHVRLARALRVEPRLRRHRLGRRLRRHQQPRARRRPHRQGHRVARRQARAAATVVGVDTWTDLALLKVDATNLPVDPLGRLVAAEGGRMGDGDRQPVSAESIGVARASSARSAAPTSGISTYEDFIQTDAAINPGQLRRRAGQRARRADRHQHGDLHAERRLSGHRLRRAEQSRAPHRRRPDASTAKCGAARSATSRSRRSRRGWPKSSARRRPRASW